ncbi:hypothetical protein CHS0354_000728 [Potamilus streckersoni]|uniref:site-specific DNA-methyltransferase (adenine-specific) n=1 Tax=Potamilus streckersoni TaxID=2493646 RepID=A0AAE0T782_9BIVA|nr:hypothetical protein CHS0354_000728 [Potamilus streckersoni]
MDKESESIGGKATFFAEDFSQYSWTKLLNNKLSGQERLDLYVRAITNMPNNPHIPQLFRDIFKGAFLPYNDPRTLWLFLKEINEFNYEHSENLGNAFEYLLSILGSQGDAGQFRTPRHIIDFIVEVVDPKKNETILDPACGTAGFLISAYKHILKQNKEKSLTPDEKLKLMNNLAGYDISPDMVKLALVNMYLHGFLEPKIHEYDTLTSDKRWDETFDVILANPPFMTPKGGIVPHKRFSIQANRAEVLFVDYIMEHLTIKGRAGIIVPEGIIFQSKNTYTALRKKLLEDGLFAVVSLPAGVFNPYSGVKTSILFFDNEVSKRTKDFLFVKIQNDGFDLGAQRRPIDKNDLPLANTDKSLVLYQSSKGSIEFKGDFSNDTFWATQAQIAEVFGVERSVITKHIKSIYEDNEVDKNSTCAFFAQVQKEGNRLVERQIEFYNLDIILSVGYRTNSKIAIEFRKWATKTLKEHLIKGYTINKKRIKQNYDEFIQAVNNIHALLPQETRLDTKNILELVKEFAPTFSSIDNYDKNKLSPIGKTKSKIKIAGEELVEAVRALKNELIKKGEATVLFAKEKNEGVLAGILGNVMQTVFGEDAYKTAEEKAAHLLYFIVKNHPFDDGNKRTGAFAFKNHPRDTHTTHAACRRK